jgi:tetratricopeptide (TPR) repeat protein
MGLHEALSLHGLTYVTDPTTPFVEFSKKKTEVDFLQFPSQTLRYKAGDCDDISILYNALLESVGIDTAFITVPGHIFTAFMIDVPPKDLATRFTSIGLENFIVKDDRVWVPVEVTSINEGFLKAWYIGAEEWRKAESSGAARLYPTHDSWESYEAVGFQADSARVTLPDEKKVLATFLAEKKKFVNGEIQPLVASYQKLIKDSKKDPKYVNKLGTLYAKYGLFSDAEKQYEALVASNYAPAVLNMGNVQFLKNDVAKAMTYYQKALKLQPGNAKALICLAIAYSEQGKYEESRKYYAQARDADPALASRYNYIESAQESGPRGSSAEGRVTEWDE